MQVDQSRAVVVMVTVSCAVRRGRYLSRAGVSPAAVHVCVYKCLAEVLCVAQKAGFRSVLSLRRAGCGDEACFATALVLTRFVIILYIISFSLSE